jgi:excisionase family DNA binding protein
MPLHPTRIGRRREPTRSADLTLNSRQGEFVVHDLDRLTHDTPDSTTTTESPPAWSREHLRELGVTTDLMTAARILGVGRTTAYRLARAGTFPVPAVRVGRTYRIPVARLIELLGLDEEPRS